MREPDIKIYPLSDLYISPIELSSDEPAHQHNAMYELIKGETKTINGYDITFTRFDMGTHSQSGAMVVGAVLNVSAMGNTHEAIPRLMFNERGEPEMIPAELPVLHAGTDGNDAPHVSLSRINVEQKKIFLEMAGLENQPHAAAPSQLVVEISTKPLMMVLWTGVILIIAGTAIEFKRRVLIFGTIRS